MLAQLSDPQLLEHLAGLGAWTATRAGELRWFADRLATEAASATGDSQKQSSLRYALGVYLDGVEDLVRRCREVQAEVERRVAARGVVPGAGD